MNLKFKPPNPTFIQAKHYGGKQTPRRIVMHSAVTDCKPGAARAVARYFQITTRAASAHYNVDPSEVIQCVGDHTVAYHCGHNQDSIGVEFCEYPARGKGAKQRWNSKPHRQMERRAARLVARLCLAYGIKPRFLGPVRLRLGLDGITTHNLMSQVYKKSTHWDPGAWRRRRFMKDVRRIMRKRRKKKRQRIKARKRAAKKAGKK